eukprot:15465918-Alexandrium_andersonii.AAC.1
MRLLGILLAVFASAYNPVRSVVTRVSKACAEVEVSDVRRSTAYGVPYFGTDAFVLLSTSMIHEPFDIIVDMG